jgi:hypothetical protein
MTRRVEALVMDGIKYLSIRFPLEVYEDLRLAAFERHEPMTGMVVEATRKELVRIRRQQAETEQATA